MTQISADRQQQLIEASELYERVIFKRDVYKLIQCLVAVSGVLASIGFFVSVSHAFDKKAYFRVCVIITLNLCSINAYMKTNEVFNKIIRNFATDIESIKNSIE